MARGKKTVNVRQGTDTDKVIGVRIRARRDDEQLSQAELGRVLGVSFQQIQKYEKGTNRLSGSRIVMLCEALKVDPNTLLGWNEKANAIDGAAFDLKAFRLAKDFLRLPDQLKNHFSRLIKSILGDED